MQIFFCCRTDCAYLSQMDRDNECLLIVEHFDKYNPFFGFSGTNPYTNKKCDCINEQSYRWWNEYQEKIEIGDTIIKRKGELIFNIHKKDTVLSYNWECEGKIYK